MFTPSAGASPSGPLSTKQPGTEVTTNTHSLSPTAEPVAPPGSAPSVVVEPDTTWTDAAACRGLDPNVFYPLDEVDESLARRVCATCPVQGACLEWAIARREPDGIWGGLTATERKRLVRRRRRVARLAQHTS